jgi:hypothetical protein
LYIYAKTNGYALILIPATFLSDRPPSCLSKDEARRIAAKYRKIAGNKLGIDYSGVQTPQRRAASFAHRCRGKRLHLCCKGSCELYLLRNPHRP